MNVISKGTFEEARTDALRGSRNTSLYTWFLVLGGVCFISRALAALVVGPPPAIDAALIGWIETAKVAMIISNEALVIGATCLIAGLFGVQDAFRAPAPGSDIAGRSEPGRSARQHPTGLVGLSRLNP